MTTAAAASRPSSMTASSHSDVLSGSTTWGAASSSIRRISSAQEGSSASIDAPAPTIIVIGPGCDAIRSIAARIDSFARYRPGVPPSRSLSSAACPSCATEVTDGTYDTNARKRTPKNSFQKEGTRSVTTNAVGICRRAGRGAGGCCAVDRFGRVVGADRAAVAEEGAAFSLSRSQAPARPRGIARDSVRVADGDLVDASAGRARLRFRGDVLAAAR